MRAASLLVATLVAATSAPSAAPAQRLDVSGGGTVTIGDSVTLVFSAALPSGATIESPLHPRDSLPSSVRLVDVDSLPSGSGALRYRVHLAFYATGSLTSPAFAVTYRMPEREQPDSLVSGAVLVTVTPTLPDTATAMRDIRAFAPLGSEERSRWWLAFAALLLIAAVAAVAWRARRRSASEARAPAPVPPPAAYDAARTRLAEIRRAGWAATDVERHYDATAEVLRAYLESALGVPAVHRTTRELARALAGRPGADAQASGTATVLGEADLVKYARLRPDSRRALDFSARVEALLDDWHAREQPAAAGHATEVSDAAR